MGLSQPATYDARALFSAARAPPTADPVRRTEATLNCCTVVPTMMWVPFKVRPQGHRAGRCRSQPNQRAFPGSMAWREPRDERAARYEGGCFTRSIASESSNLYSCPAYILASQLGSVFAA